VSQKECDFGFNEIFLAESSDQFCEPNLQDETSSCSVKDRNVQDTPLPALDKGSKSWQNVSLEIDVSLRKSVKKTLTV
jgi:hypothetical protein